jgi:hypothetical protein
MANFCLPSKSQQTEYLFTPYGAQNFASQTAAQYSNNKTTPSSTCSDEYRALRGGYTSSAPAPTYRGYVSTDAFFNGYVPNSNLTVS